MPIEDPDDLERVDREIHINELKRQAKEAAGGDMVTHESEEIPPQIREQFWEQVVAFETAPLTTHFEKLVEGRMELPHPESMDDETLSATLQELIKRLAAMRVFLHSTDHLSDRQLYTHLCSDSLREKHPDLPFDENSCWHIDLVSSGSEEDTEAWLKYFADQKTRQDWVDQFPDYVLPEHEDPPHDRDRHLPQPTYGDASRPDLEAGEGS